MSIRYHATSCQMDPPCAKTRDEVFTRTEWMCELIEGTITGYEPFFDVRLLVFAQFAHGAPICGTVGKPREHMAVVIPNEHSDRYACLAAKHGCHIQTGTSLKADPDHTEAVFNTIVCVGPSGVLGSYQEPLWPSN
ncbi:MAG: hypothetical protein JXQ75_02660 [Phycisphaerae bacterium]|nr:hypothetical protein [Phycisphaerae bacterium]